MKYRFVGRGGIYQVPYGAIVEVVKFYPKRRALVRYKGKLYLTMTCLLRRVES